MMMMMTTICVVVVVVCFPLLFLVVIHFFPSEIHPRMMVVAVVLSDEQWAYHQADHIASELLDRKVLHTLH